MMTQVGMATGKGGQAGAGRGMSSLPGSACLVAMLPRSPACLCLQPACLHLRRLPLPLPLPPLFKPRCRHPLALGEEGELFHYKFVRVPAAAGPPFLPHHHHRHLLAPAGNHWRMGEEGELFQYKFVGRHSVQSGFTSVLLAHELAALQYAGHSREARPSRKQAAAGLEERSWLAFLQHVKGSSGEGLWPTPSLPFLFAGEGRSRGLLGPFCLHALLACTVLSGICYRRAMLAGRRAALVLQLLLRGIVAL